MNNNITEFIKMVHLDFYKTNFQSFDINVDNKTNTITIMIELPENSRTCPHCNLNKSIHIHSRLTKKIYHPVISNRNCIIILNHKKYRCNICGKHYNQQNILCNGNKNITLVDEINILKELRKFKTTFSDVSNNYFIPYSSVIRCFDEHVAISKHSLTKVLCFDEIYTKNLSKTKYAFIIFNPMTSTIIDVLDVRLKNVLEDYFANIPLKERLIANYVNIDMWDTYKIVAEKFFPNVTICIDSFHVIKHLNNAMNEVRKKIQRRFASTKFKDKRGYYWLLKSFNYYLLKDFNNIKYVRKPRSKFSYLWTKHDVLDSLLSIDKDLKKAYYLKEEYREFNLCADYNEALKMFDEFIFRFKASKFEEFRKFGKLIQSWKIYIINSFLKIDGKRMSNEQMESLNGRIRRIMSNSYGFKNFQRLKKKIMFSLNDDEPIKF